MIQRHKHNSYRGLFNVTYDLTGMIVAVESSNTRGRST